MVGITLIWSGEGRSQQCALWRSWGGGGGSRQGQYKGGVPKASVDLDPANYSGREVEQVGQWVLKDSELRTGRGWRKRTC